MRSLVRPALSLMVALSILGGLAYPLALTGLAQVAFPRQANGSLIVIDGQILGSDLVGQPFSDPGDFWARPSATGPFPYNAMASAASNQGPANPDLAAAVARRLAELRALDPANEAPVPVDLVTASASGLDPEISLVAALYQADRVAHARGLPAGEVRALVWRHVRGRPGGLTPQRVGVLELNLALDRMAKMPPPGG